MDFRLKVEHLGPVPHADVAFGDLTVLVGPQASGKSLFLETLKLVLDGEHIHQTFHDHNMDFTGNREGFLGGYYGRGLERVLGSHARINWNGNDLFPDDLSVPPALASESSERLFYIPAQRVMSLPHGISQPFSSFQYGDPYVFRAFADRVHQLLQKEFATLGRLFPAKSRLDSALRTPLQEHLFAGGALALEAREFTRTLTLIPEGMSEGISYLAWSAGQREFVPLLLGLYWLCPGGRVTRRDALEWVVIEEPETGLHPRAIQAVLLLVLELLSRDYRVVLSTHSTEVLDMVWALQVLKDHQATYEDVLSLFELGRGPETVGLAKRALECAYKVYFFEAGQESQDISALDPGADGELEALWGDLARFAGRAADVVSSVVGRSG